ncbi:MAG: hypothetical protein H9W81_21960 [Enterococcus sp.]|nr:hypothetical protein [Enterococcus sp.]
MIKRTKLSRSKNTEEVSENYTSPLAASGAAVPESESARNHVATAARGITGIAKTIISLAVLAMVVFIAVYTSLAGTLMFVAPTVDGDKLSERAWVARGTFVGGKIDPGTQVYGSATTLAPDNFMGKMMEGYTGAPDAFIAEVFAGPIADISTDKNKNVLINGEKSGYTGEVKATQLRSQFIAVCVSGECEPGEIVIIESGSISGEYKGTLSFSGMEKPVSVKDVASDDKN